MKKQKLVYTGKVFYDLWGMLVSQILNQTAQHEDAISITCTSCKHQVHFPLKIIEEQLPCIATCSQCNKKYGIESGTISRQLNLFIALCRQLKKSEEILSSASVAVSVGPHEVKVPFKLLLSRLRSTLDLDIGGTKVSFSYRTEPVNVATSLETLEKLSEEEKKFSSTM